MKDANPIVLTRNVGGSRNHHGLKWDPSLALNSYTALGCQSVCCYSLHDARRNLYYRQNHIIGYVVAHGSPIPHLS